MVLNAGVGKLDDSGTQFATEGSGEWEEGGSDTVFVQP